MVSLPVAPPEERISLPKLANEQGVSPVSTWRWALRGIAGVKLQTFCVGSKRYTTRNAFATWCEQVTAARSGDPIPSRTNRQRETAIAQAERELEEMGI